MYRAHTWEYGSFWTPLLAGLEVYFLVRVPLPVYSNGVAVSRLYDDPSIVTLHFTVGEVWKASIL